MPSAELRAICGGGRYDNLLSSLGGADLPAVGFGMGDVVPGELLKDRGLAPPLPAPIDVLVAGIAEQDLPTSFASLTSCAMAEFASSSC
mgnify:CR=1 FL=1